MSQGKPLDEELELELFMASALPFIAIVRLKIFCMGTVFAEFINGLRILPDIVL